MKNLDAMAGPSADSRYRDAISKGLALTQTSNARTTRVWSTETSQIPVAPTLFIENSKSGPVADPRKTLMELAPASSSLGTKRAAPKRSFTTAASPQSQTENLKADVKVSLLEQKVNQLVADQQQHLSTMQQLADKIDDTARFLAVQPAGIPKSSAPASAPGTPRSTRRLTRSAQNSFASWDSLSVRINEALGSVLESAVAKQKCLEDFYQKERRATKEEQKAKAQLKEEQATVRMFTEHQSRVLGGGMHGKKPELELKTAGNMLEELRTLRRSMRASQAQLRELKEENDGLQAVKDALATSEAKFQNLEARYTAAQLSARGRIMELETSTKLRNELSALKQSMHSTQEQLNELQEENIALQAAKDALKASEAKYHDLEVLFNAAKTESSLGLDAASKLQDELNTLTQSMRTSQVEVDELKAKNHGLQPATDALEALKSKYDDLQAQYAVAKEESSSERETSENLRHELSALKQLMCSSQDQLDQLKEENKGMQAAKDALMAFEAKYRNLEVSYSATKRGPEEPSASRPLCDIQGDAMTVLCDLLQGNVEMPRAAGEWKKLYNETLLQEARIKLRRDGLNELYGSTTPPGEDADSPKHLNESPLGDKFLEAVAHLFSAESENQTAKLEARKNAEETILTHAEKKHRQTTEQVGQSVAQEERQSSANAENLDSDRVAEQQDKHEGEIGEIEDKMSSLQEELEHALQEEREVRHKLEAHLHHRQAPP
eukprot:GEMP01008109.1.p1 GENE.GEMP01008109.1~~GEMP01008109.1.p1  ORF type:complete len:725 (+),score=187.00 GEMP01008109.1:62-2236(+)